MSRVTHDPAPTGSPPLSPADQSTTAAIDPDDRENALVMASQVVGGGDPIETAALEAKARRSPAYFDALVRRACEINDSEE